jgi:hypothetical protein
MAPIPTPTPENPSSNINIIIKSSSEKLLNTILSPSTFPIPPGTGTGTETTDFRHPTKTKIVAGVFLGLFAALLLIALPLALFNYCRARQQRVREGRLEI